MKRKLRVLDLFSGTGSSTAAFEARGHEVVRVELDPVHDAHLHADIFALDVATLADLGPFHFIWASPPCQSFSVASIGHHWRKAKPKNLPKTEAARFAQDLVAHTIRLIAGLNPRHGWVAENPRAMLRKLECVRGLDRVTLTYCQYGDTRQKPTDLWGAFPSGWTPRPACAAGGGLP